MQIYRLGSVSWSESQLYYHALARTGRQGLILCSPNRPYVCIGFHQDMTQELDQAFCRRKDLPIFRREVGGGAVYLDSGQIFWQLVLRKDNPLVTKNHRAFYRRFLEPVAAVYRRLGVSADVRGVNDLGVGRCKISGTGAGEIGECVVFVGNLIRRFEYETMARVLKFPDHHFRRSYLRIMEQNLSSLRKELGREAEIALSDRFLYDLLADCFARLLGRLAPSQPDQELRSEVQRLARRMLAPEWQRFPRPVKRGRRVKVCADLFLNQLVVQTGKGEMRFLCLEDQGRVRSLHAYQVQCQGQEPVGLKRLRGFRGYPVKRLQAALRDLLVEDSDFGIYRGYAESAPLVC